MRPEDTARGHLHGTRRGLQVARQQPQQCGFATAFVATNPAQTGRPAETQILDDWMLRMVQ